MPANKDFLRRIIILDQCFRRRQRHWTVAALLEEVNRRLQMMANMDPLDTEVVWQDFLPQNQTEQMAYYQALQAMGIVSKETVADKLGIEWELEQERLDSEKQAGDNLGAFLLTQFNQGGGASMPQFGGQQTAVVTGISTLVIAALFTSLRKRIQNDIDRRFFRKKYDAQQVLAHFAVTARNETDLDALAADLARVVQDALQPEGVSVWLREAQVRASQRSP